ncbi:MAG: DnaA regulatory inactivator Hda [Gammaproteobacteria bacterium]|nr:DnaA regulatory inactivator Hda [Gammaproteobacteria bacterium]
MQNQLPLSFQAPENAVFDNFVLGDNQQLIHSLENEAEQLLFIWGETGSGKSHLLQAITSQYLSNESSALYIPLKLDDEFPPELLDGLEVMDLVCLDDVHKVMGNRKWEEALFHFFNRIRENNGRLILAAENNAVNLDINLPDLKSRLTWGLTYQVKLLCDDDKITVLKLRAHQRGFKMTDDIAQYLLNRATRNMSELIKLLDKLDYESLAEQRKVTIPFIKQYL